MHKFPDPKYYTLHNSRTGLAETFDNARDAGQAFFEANPDDKPVVIYGNQSTAQTIARTMKIGSDLRKSLPFETDPAFTQAYLDAKAAKPQDP